jgi:hypothetical protein
MADQEVSKSEAVAKVLYAIAGLRDIETSLVACACRPEQLGRPAWLLREDQKRVLDMLSHDDRVLANVGLPSEKFAALAEQIAYSDRTEFEAFLAATRDVRERYEQCLRIGGRSEVGAP